MKWVAYCIDCQKEIYKANNGQFVEAYAETHQEETGHNNILIGYKIKVKEV